MKNPCLSFSAKLRRAATTAVAVSATMLLAAASAAAGDLSATVKKASAPTIGQSDNVGYWLVAEDGKPVLQYNYATVTLPEGFFKTLKKGDRRYAFPRSNYIHPLYGLDGAEITADWNRDHPHHRGIYWAWPEVAYKGKLHDLHAGQNVFAHPTGKIETTRNADGSLTLVAENLWFWENKEAIATEQTKITVFPRTANERKINLEFHFTALKDGVTIARRQTKHYGGLNVRMAKLPGWKEFSFRDKKSPAQNPAWTGATWKNATGGHSELLAFEKRDNPCYPGEFITYPNLNWFQPTFPTGGTRFPLKTTEPLVLRFQLLIHETALADADRAGAWKAFQN
ncbi:MAG: PmoA family protein [Puniceicoccales bacterium]|jgi:hypothetical protein|nr:PmoA family protein [Puniceicoccales bacterium]